MRPPVWPHLALCGLGSPELCYVDTTRLPDGSTITSPPGPTRTHLDIPTVLPGAATVLELHFELHAFNRHQLQLQLIQVAPPPPFRAVCTSVCVFRVCHRGRQLFLMGSTVSKSALLAALRQADPDDNVIRPRRDHRFVPCRCAHLVCSPGVLTCSA